MNHFYTNIIITPMQLLHCAPLLFPQVNNHVAGKKDLTLLNIV